jgi:hypothetical protein
VTGYHEQKRQIERLEVAVEVLKRLLSFKVDENGIARIRIEGSVNCNDSTSSDERKILERGE